MDEEAQKLLEEIEVEIEEFNPTHLEAIIS